MKNKHWVIINMDIYHLSTHVIERQHQTFYVNLMCNTVNAKCMYQYHCIVLFYFVNCTLVAKLIILPIVVVDLYRLEMSTHSSVTRNSSHLEFSMCRLFVLP